VSAPRLNVQRVYDEPSPVDGLRVLVDRLWARGVTRARAKVNEWLRDVAPSVELRRWFGHDAVLWEEFTRRYRIELAESSALERLLALVTHGPVTLLYGARDEAHNNAIVLRDVIEERRGER
jgi:uncharacterized protein YeaO (DUF488 family)